MKQSLWKASNCKLRCLVWLYSQEKCIKSSGTVHCSETLLLHLSDKLDLPSRSSANVISMVKLSQSCSAVKGSFLCIHSTLCWPLLHWVVIAKHWMRINGQLGEKTAVYTLASRNQQSEPIYTLRMKVIRPPSYIGTGFYKNICFTFPSMSPRFSLVS